MTNKLVVIINSLKVQKIKKILLYEISCTKLQLPPEPLTRGLTSPDPRSLCPQLNLSEFVDPPSPEQNSWVRHWCQETSTCHTAQICLSLYCSLYRSLVTGRSVQQTPDTTNNVILLSSPVMTVLVAL